MRIFKYLLLFIAFGVMLGACSKDDDPILEGEETGQNLAYYSLKIEFDEESFNPEWTMEIKGSYMLHKSKDLTITGYDFEKELDEFLESIERYSTYFTAGSKPVTNFDIESNQKSETIMFTMLLDNVAENETPKGKVYVLKDGKVVKEVPIKRSVLIIYPSKD